VVRIVAALCVACLAAFVAAPRSTPTPLVPTGVTVAGLHVGGLSAEPLRARLEAAMSRPLTIDDGTTQTLIDPASLDAEADIDAAVSSAFTAAPESSHAVPVAFSEAKVQSAVEALAKRYDRPAHAARVVGATTAGPLFAPSRPGVAIDVAAMTQAIDRLLEDGSRPPLELITRVVPAKRTAATFGPVIVVDRAANALRLYDGTKLVRKFAVATGQAIYPTPAGIWFIKDKQKDPWWYPPTYDAWAKGLSPVPPGPSNPLGTRWMGLNAPGVGIHGTDEPTSIGYSESHGCVRMQVPDAEWLFEHVHVGTQVVIL
jgi:lipoprotein-anchoring transpeptidase ErfK/SrfK